MVKVCTFDGAERIGPPRNWDDTRGACLDIFVTRSMEHGAEPWMHSIYRFSSEEIEALALGGVLRLSLPGVTHPVFRMGVLSRTLADAAGARTVNNGDLGSVIRAPGEAAPLATDVVMRIAREAWAKGARNDQHSEAIRSGAYDDDIPKSVIRAVQLALCEPPAPDMRPLPCDVIVAPATTVKAGVSRDTLREVIEARDDYIADGNSVEPVTEYWQRKRDYGV